jgi:hypothetical protein
MLRIQRIPGSNLNRSIGNCDQLFRGFLSSLPVNGWTVPSNSRRTLTPPFLLTHCRKSCFISSEASLITEIYSTQLNNPHITQPIGTWRKSSALCVCVLQDTKQWYVSRCQVEREWSIRLGTTDISLGGETVFSVGSRFRLRGSVWATRGLLRGDVAQRGGTFWLWWADRFILHCYLPWRDRRCINCSCQIRWLAYMSYSGNNEVKVMWCTTDKNDENALL